MTDASIYVRREKKKVRQLKYTSSTSFESYIREIVQLFNNHTRQDDHGKASISRQALSIADSVILNLFQEIAKEARKMMVSAKRRTLMAWDIQCAVMQHLKGEVARHAASEGHKAVMSYVDMARRR